MRKRILAIILSLAFIWTHAPQIAFAEGTEGIVLYANNGTEESKTVTDGSLTLTDNVFTYGKCVIESWNTALDGSGTSYSVGDTVTEDIMLYAQWVLPLNELDAFDDTGNFGYTWTGRDTSPYTFTMKDGTTLHARVVFPNNTEDAESIIAVDGNCTITGNLTFSTTGEDFDYSATLKIQGAGSLGFLEMGSTSSGATLIVEAVSSDVELNVTIEKELNIGRDAGMDSKVVINNATLTLEDELLLQYLEMTNAVLNIGKTATFVPLSDFDPNNSAYRDKTITLDEYSEINIQGTPAEKLCTNCTGICVQGYSGCDICSGSDPNLFCNWYDEDDDAWGCNPPTVTMSPTNGGYIRMYYDAVLGDLVEGEHPRDAFDRLVEENYFPVGYHFTGDGNSYYLLDGEDKPVTGPVKIKKRFTLTYDANGGTGSMTGKSVIYAGDTYTLLANDFTAPTDCVFAGWEVGGVIYDEGESITIKGNTTVRAVWAEVAPSYTVTIPATATPGTAFTVSAEATVLRDTQTLTVAITGTSGTGNAFTLKNEKGVELGYTLKNGETEIALNDKLLTLTDKQTGSVNIAIVPAQAQYSGNYTGTVTFTIALEEAQSQ